RPACGTECVAASEPAGSANTAKGQHMVNYWARRMARTAHACGDACVAAGGDNRSSANPMEASVLSAAPDLSACVSRVLLHCLDIRAVSSMRKDAPAAPQ